MINLAVLHGFNGLRQVLDEYVIRPGRRVIAHTLIWTMATFLIGIGTYAILLFRQDDAYIQEWKARRATPVTAEARVVPGPVVPAR